MNITFTYRKLFCINKVSHCANHSTFCSGLLKGKSFPGPWSRVAIMDGTRFCFPVALSRQVEELHNVRNALWLLRCCWTRGFLRNVLRLSHNCTRTSTNCYSSYNRPQRMDARREACLLFDWIPPPEHHRYSSL
jgi:hypothetical protein